MSDTTLTRNAEIQQIHRDYANFYTLFGGIALVLIGVFIGAVLFSGDSGYGTNLYTEAISVGLTIFVLNVLQDRRDKKNRIIELQEDLVRQAGSRSHDTAITAIDMMRKRGWLGRSDDTEALLKEVDLSNAILHGAYLDEVNLQNSILCETTLDRAILWRANMMNASMYLANMVGAELFEANLMDADMENCNLEKADLQFTNLLRANLKAAKLMYANLENANLQRAILSRAKFQGAKFLMANLRGADLSYADLRGTNLMLAVLSKVNLDNAKFDEKTVLPDAKSLGRDIEGNFIFDKYWTPDTDMTRYTNPNHPDFWQPDWVKEQ